MALEHFAVVGLVATAATGALCTVLPSIGDLRNGAVGDDIEHDLNTGLVIGGGIVLTMAGMAAFMSGNLFPLTAALLTILSIALGYHWALRTKGTEDLI